jgi:hypothetical protein
MVTAGLIPGAGIVPKLANTNEPGRALAGVRARAIPGEVAGLPRAVSSAAVRQAKTSAMVTRRLTKKKLPGAGFVNGLLILWAYALGRGRIPP